MTKQTKTTQSNLQINLKAAAYLTAIGMVASVNTAYADWFQVGDIKTNLITPIYNLVNDNLGYIAFAVGGGATFLARGLDWWQKGMALGAGALGTAGAVKLAQTVLHLG